MEIRIICVGKLKENYWKDAAEEYSKRLSRFCNIKILEIKEARLPDKASAAEEETVKREEGEGILKQIRDEDFVISLEIQGKSLSSEEMAEKIENLGLAGRSNLVFVIGGSLGLSPEVSRRADFHLSFSRMTFPHQMMRVILLEQIYRSFKIIRNETYHK